jgi:hypothetical protein
MVVKAAVLNVFSFELYAWYSKLLQMLGNLKNPPEPFAEIIRTHFRLKARSIAAQLDQWLAQDDGKPTNTGEYQGPGHKDGPGGSSNGLAKDVADMKQVMQQL